MSDSGYTDEDYTASGPAPDSGPPRPSAAPDKATEEEENKEPEAPPEPEVDPLEGLTYDDDPDAPLPPYGDLSYWEQRYTDDTAVYEWYQEPDVILPKLKSYLDGEGIRILVLGTGNSDMAPQLAQSGAEAVVAIDFAKPAIVKSRRRNREVENLSWKVMDVRKLQFPDGDFQIVFDKGTLDCLFFVGEGDVNVALGEVSRVLKRGGRFICVSYVEPEEMRPFLDRAADLRFQIEKIVEITKPLPSESVHYLYVVKKVGKVVLKKQ
jgi:ubiquinone/menaquinone biosynthesis C-methylase UbiE